ncbi:MAG TPA: hypothetical protein VNJ01_04115 [Bacteriovoracaceae bacterium]|nr:hypothetical protein [Bacteriovoracaceae bacterium]
MKRLIVLLLTYSCFTQAQTFQVLERGHSYEFIQSGSLSLNHPKAKLTIDKTPCSQDLIKELSATFHSSLRTQIENPADPKDLIQIKSGSKTVYVPTLHKNGLLLQKFPDTFMKSYLVFKKLCPVK